MPTSIARYFTQKNVMGNFRKLVHQGAEPSSLRSLLDVILTGHTLDAHSISCKHIYRSRGYEKGRLFSHVDELKYPPARFITTKGRLNDIGQSVFYGSSTELGTLIEARPERDQLFVISKIDCIRPDQLMFLPLGMDPHNYVPSSAMLSAKAEGKASRLVTEFLRQEMTQLVTEPAGYNGSIAIANHFFRACLLNYGGSDRLGLIFPSVHGRKISNVTTYNLGMLPRTFDENYQISQVDVYSLTYEVSRHELVLISLNTGTVRKNGLIDWQHNLEEMRKRTEAGIFGLDIKNEEIKRVAELI